MRGVVKLTWQDDRPSRLYPHGYWHATTDDGNHDGVGPDPQTAITALAASMERALRPVRVAEGEPKEP